MRRRSVFIVLIAVAAGFSDLAATSFSMSAMACCAKAHNQCAGLNAPDDCCQRMGHASVHDVADVVAKAQLSGFAVLAAVPGFVATVALVRLEPLADIAFKRPHDPPHLHPFSLLI